MAERYNPFMTLEAKRRMAQIPPEFLAQLTPSQREQFLAANSPQRFDGTVAPRAQQMTNVNPTLRDRAFGAAVDAFGMSPEGRRRANMTMNALDTVDPGAMILSDAMRDYNQGNTGQAAIGTGIGLAGVIPGVAQISKAAKGLPLDRIKLGREYPAIGEPVQKFDKRKQQFYTAKGPSPEGEALSAELALINEDIAAGNYTPFYPIEERTFVDSSKYDIQGNTLTDKLPKKQETADKFKAQFDTPEVRARLNAAFDAGDNPDAKNWYAMAQLEADFIKELGETKGREMFKERFADAMAATTGGADPGSNLRLAAYMNYLKEGNRPIPFVTEGLAGPHIPYPIGAGKYGAKGNVQMYDQVINQGKGLSASQQPKRSNFSSNFLGDMSRATIDEQMMTVFGGATAPPGDSYGVIERILGDEAAKRGVQPGNFQDQSWAGIKGIEGKPMIQFVNEAIERTSRVTGKTPAQVVKDSLINAKSPLYSLLTGLGLGGAAMSQAPGEQTQSPI